MLLKNQPELAKAVKLSLPVIFAYFPLGMVFGVLFTNAGFAWYLAPLMSVFVYGGSVQFIALSMMEDHSGVFAILFATLFVAVRNSFYGLSLLERFKTRWLLKAFFIFGLVDATYAILMTHPAKKNQDDIKFCFYLTLVIYLSWTLGTFVGALFSNYLPHFSGLSFILPCFFLVLVVEYYLSTKSLQSIIAPIIFAAIAYYMMPNNYLFMAIVLSIFYIILVQSRWEVKP